MEYEQSGLLAARTAVPQLPSVLCRADYLADRHLDDAAGHELAGVPADRIGSAAGDCKLLLAGSNVLPGPDRGSLGGPLGPAADARLDAGLLDAAILSARRVDAQRDRANL